MLSAAAHINWLKSPTLSVSRRSSFLCVHMCGWERSVQELKMSELTKPYLKIAGFCKQLIFSLGSYQGSVAGASLRR